MTYIAKGGAKATTPEITLDTVCGPLSTTISLPTISTPYTYALVYNDPDLPRVTLDDATVSQSACPVETWTLTSDGVADTTLDKV